MVSFQCHGCGDVVKKPKLDQHRTRCHSGYDCIDCSKTFNTPADYKGHTSCISEAEKYEKSLYKGPKAGVPPIKSKQAPASTKHKHVNVPSSTQKAPAVEEAATPASERQSNAQWGAKSVGPSSAVAPAPTNFYGGGAGGYGRYGGWGQSRNKVTGANDTPLGTPPSRASPVTVAPPRTAALSHSNGHAQTQMQKDNKRKYGAADEAVNGDAKSNKKVTFPKEKETTVDPASIPLPSSPGPSADDSKKKHKKDKDTEKEEKKLKKKEKKEKAQKHEETADVKIAAPLGEEEKKKKSKKDKEKKKDEALVADIPGEESKADKKKKKKDAVEELTIQTNGVDVNGKSKKRKRGEEEDHDTADVDGSLSGEEKKKKRKEKKKKKEKTAEGSMDVDATPVTEATKKEKKHKKEKKDKGNVVESIPIAIAVS